MRERFCYYRLNGCHLLKIGQFVTYWTTFGLECRGKILSVYKIIILKYFLLNEPVLFVTSENKTLELMLYIG